MSFDIASVEELQARLDWTLDAGEQGVAEAALSDLSDDARFYGHAKWDSATAPRQVKSLVLRAAARYMRNPDGFVQSRAGDETLVWSDRGDEAATAAFTEKEQKMLAVMAGRGNGLVSVGITAWGPVTRRHPRYINPSSKYDRFDVGYVPSDGAGMAGTPDPIAFYGEEDPFWDEGGGERIVGYLPA